MILLANYTKIGFTQNGGELLVGTINAYDEQGKKYLEKEEQYDSIINFITDIYNIPTHNEEDWKKIYINLEDATITAIN